MCDVCYIAVYHDCVVYVPVCYTVVRVSACVVSRTVVVCGVALRGLY